jgi:tRNA1(Val) A37 N6-methylase TrmN6
VPPAVQACNNFFNDGRNKPSIPYALSFLAEANGSDTDYSQKHDVFITDLPTGSTEVPSWLPINAGEQLCNLVGKWRILQRIGSHRWTTDDIVTAYVAASTFVKTNNEDEAAIRYLDLGTGNGSVLQMVTWYLLSKLGIANTARRKTLQAFGVEARTEAVGLARRSLAFNLGRFEYNGKVCSGAVLKSNKEVEPMKHDVQIVNGDFRDLIAISNDKEQSQSNPNKDLQMVASQKYDLITGTPPYFRVDFSSSEKTAGSNSEVITTACINQGGMPTSMQSAPARCEVSLYIFHVHLYIARQSINLHHLDHTTSF